MVVESDDETLNDPIAMDEAKQKVSDSEEARKLSAVAAQIEVLYDYEETLEMLAEEGDSEAENKSKENAADHAETKTVTRTSVAVGVFEGWLSGGDNNPEEGLRWKLAQIRYPSEFPFLSGRGSIQ